MGAEPSCIDGDPAMITVSVMKPLNIAHRGGAALRPENTMAAFRSAVALGADGAELDVQLSADGVAVVHHDYRLNPALTREDGARIPSLAEVAGLSQSFLLMVELKSSTDPASPDPIALADAAFEAMKDQISRTIFVGFDWRGLTRIISRAKEARCWFTTDELKGDARMVLPFIKAAGGEGWFPSHQDATVEMVAQARALGLQVGAWTVNDPGEMKRLIGLQLDAICTDRPDILQSLKQGG